MAAINLTSSKPNAYDEWHKGVVGNWILNVVAVLSEEPVEIQRTVVTIVSSLFPFRNGALMFEFYW